MVSTMQDKAMDVRKNPRYRQLRKALKEGVYDYPFADTEKELKDLHRSLDTRKWTDKSLRRNGVKLLIGASIQNQSYRSRLVEILIQVRRYHNNLDREYQLVRDHLMQEHPDRFEGRTKEDRMRSVNALFETVISRLAQYVSLMDDIKIVIDDLDKSAWQLKTILEVSKIINHPAERNL